MISTAQDYEQYVKSHDFHFHQFVATGDFKYFEAARAIAMVIMNYDRATNAFRYGPLLEKMYERTEKL